MHKHDYNIDISNLQDRLIGIEDKINNINLEINLLKTRIEKQSKQLNLINNNSKETKELKSKAKIKQQKRQFVDPEVLFKKVYKTKRISKDSCALVDITSDDMKFNFFGTMSTITIKNNYTEQEYQILELDPINMCINILSINYDKVFDVCMAEQE